MSTICPHDRLVKHLLRRSRVVDSFFIGKFSFSPYQACSHGCRYCDGRAERYWVEGVFERDVIVRRNAAEVLAEEVGKLRERGVVFVGSGVSDAYQPPEAEARLMPACGRVLALARLDAITQPPFSRGSRRRLRALDCRRWCRIGSTAGDCRSTTSWTFCFSRCRGCTPADTRRRCNGWTPPDASTASGCSVRSSC